MMMRMEKIERENETKLRMMKTKQEKITSEEMNKISEVTTTGTY